MQSRAKERRLRLRQVVCNIQGRRLKRRLEDVGCSSFHEVLTGDSEDVLDQLPARTFDAYVSDPPAGIAFMGKAWDRFKRKGMSERDAFVRKMTKIFRKALRVLKPGAHALIWAIPRTAHWTTWALEDAGFEIRDVVVHLTAQGMPKSLDASKAIDKQQGNKRKNHGVDPVRYAKLKSQLNGQKGGTWPGRKRDVNITSAGSSDSATWEGWGTALRPLAEHWILARRPLDGTVANNLLTWGVGGINVDATRIAYSDEADKASARPQGKATSRSGAFAGKIQGGNKRKEYVVTQRHGRFPPNMTFAHTSDCVQDGHRPVKSGVAVGRNRDKDATGGGYSYSQKRKVVTYDATYADKSGKEKLPKWKCAKHCPLRHLEEFNEGASKSFPVFSPDDLHHRFVYAAKITNKDRSSGGRVDNDHPTVKSRGLMRWLLSLICPPKAIVLDTFNGSGSTGVTCMELGISYVGIERHEPYVKITKKRFKYEARAIVETRSKHKIKGMRTLFR